MPLGGWEQHSEKGNSMEATLGAREENQAESSVAAGAEGEVNRAGLGCGVTLHPLGRGVVKVEATMVIRRGRRLVPGWGQGRVSGPGKAAGGVSYGSKGRESPRYDAEQEGG